MTDASPGHSLPRRMLPFRLPLLHKLPAGPGSGEGLSPEAVLRLDAGLVINMEQIAVLGRALDGEGDGVVAVLEGDVVAIVRAIGSVHRHHLF